MGRATTHCFGLAPGTWGVVNMSNIIKLQLQSKFQRFLYQILCVHINERYKIYQMEFSICGLGHAQGVGFRESLGSNILAWGFAMAPWS